MEKATEGKYFSIMTIFEQTIDTSQVQMELSIFGAFLTMVIGVAIIFALIIFLEKKIENHPVISMISFALIMIAGLLGIVFSFMYIPPVQALSEPVYSEHQSRKIKYDSKDTVTDIYREDIDQAIKDKLGEYKVPEYSVDNPQESILGGGDEERSIAAVHDGETYTLTPQWNYDRAVSYTHL